MQAQPQLIAAYEVGKWPRRPPSTADVIKYLMDQHGVTRADLVPILGAPSRVNEVLRGKKGLSMAMVQRLRARFGVPADILLPPAQPPDPPREQASRLTPRVRALGDGLRNGGLWPAGTLSHAYKKNRAHERARVLDGLRR